MTVWEFSLDARKVITPPIAEFHGVCVHNSVLPPDDLVKRHEDAQSWCREGAGTCPDPTLQNPSPQHFKALEAPSTPLNPICHVFMASAGSVPAPARSRDKSPKP